MVQPKKEVVENLEEKNDAPFSQKPWKKVNKARFNPIVNSPKIEIIENQLIRKDI